MVGVKTCVGDFKSDMFSLAALVSLTARVASAASTDSFTIGITGDVNLNPTLKNKDPSFVWGDLAPITRAVDVMSIQHESTLAEIRDLNPETIQFEDPLDYTETYASAGIDYITIANNHQFDFGFDGISGTYKTLDAIGIPYSGLGRNASDVRTPRIVETELPSGKSVSVAYFTLVIDECWKWPNGSLYLDGCTCGPSANPKHDPPYQCYEANATMPGLWYQFGIDDRIISDMSTTVHQYKTANPTHLVVVYMHVGPNFQWVPYPIHEQLLRNASAAGADLVWGTSSHHIQRFEVYDGKPIVYGLGDLLFRHVVGVEDWCPIYARPCESYHPELSLMYVFEVDAKNSVPKISLSNITAYGTKHSDFQTGILTNASDSSWLVSKFNEVAIGARLQPQSTLGHFDVVVN